MEPINKNHNTALKKRLVNIHYSATSLLFFQYLIFLSDLTANKILIQCIPFMHHDEKD